MKLTELFYFDKNITTEEYKVLQTKIVDSNLIFDSTISELYRQCFKFQGMMFTLDLENLITFLNTIDITHLNYNEEELSVLGRNTQEEIANTIIEKYKSNRHNYTYCNFVDGIFTIPSADIIVSLDGWGNFQYLYGINDETYDEILVSRNYENDALINANIYWDNKSLVEVVEGLADVASKYLNIFQN